MTSNALTGERRWASARRSGMTVLGKVAVPKPINLPSQRLENHGLDPSVEIVPKGTLSWGSRSASSTPNAWGSSMLSPHTDSGTASPSNLSGRPSSGGSGTRPSTAGSDRANDLFPSAWGSNSRPSSASGVVTSNQTSLASLRPRSAETRPGSSHLSRFAEPLSENSAAWSAVTTAEKLGVSSSKNHGFSLTSGDFPTLGSEKDSSGKDTESQEHFSHARPGSSSGVVAVKERIVAGDVHVNSNARSGSANSWRRDDHTYSEEGVRPNIDNWKADPQGQQLYPNASMPPQNYDTWHGPPINNHPGGVWYGGPPNGPPYGGPPGGFPMEPFPYYRPQIPGNALPNPQSIPHPGVGPRGHHPKNGDMYMPPIPDHYIRPGMPIRPGFYHGHVPCEGYYGPPMGYCNPNDRDTQFMGMPAGPSPYNRHSGSNAPDPGSSHARSSGYSPESLESGHPHEMRGPYKVLLKQQDGLNEKDEQKWGDSRTIDLKHQEKGDKQIPSSWENDWGAENEKDEEMDKKRKVTSDHRGHGSSVIVKSDSPKSVKSRKEFDENSVKKVQHKVSPSPEVSYTTKDYSLIEKIEGLNAKTRASDGRHDSSYVSSKEEQKIKPQVDKTRANYSMNEHQDGGAFGKPILTERSQAIGLPDSASHENDSYVDRDLEFAGATVSRRSTHGIQGRGDHRGKGRFNSHDVDGWRKKSTVADPSEVVHAANSRSSIAHGQDSRSVVAIEKSHSQEKNVEESLQAVFDPSDSQAQRAMMRELAKQRVIQRQKEEEERIRDQKAKALAKLEELNRRTKTAEEVSKDSEDASGNMQSKMDGPGTLQDPDLAACRTEASSSALAVDHDVVANVSESSKLEKPTALSSGLPAKSLQKEILPLKQEFNNSGGDHGSNPPIVIDGGPVKQRQLGYKQKQNLSADKNFTEKSPLRANEVVKVVPSAVVVVGSEIVPIIDPNSNASSNIKTDPLVHEKRKNHRSGKNKSRVEEVSSTTALAPLVSKESNLTGTLAESGKPKASASELAPNLVISPVKPKDANEFSEHGSLPEEETNASENNQWKSHYSRKTVKNSQANKSADKFQGEAVIWAPVRTQNKTEVSSSVSQKAVVEATIPLMKHDTQVQSNPRNKRAEMERYDPKPVAKELAQQGGSQPTNTSSVHHSLSGDTHGVVDSGSQSIESSQPVGLATGKKAGHTLEPRNGDGKQTKHGKGHGAWRKRPSAELTIVQNLQDEQSSISSRNVQEPSEHKIPPKHDLSFGREPPKDFDEWNASDGWEIPEIPDSVAQRTVAVAKDQGVSSRGKKHISRGHKGTGIVHDDHKKINHGDANRIYKQSFVPEASHIDTTIPSKDNRAVGDRSTPQWQPKSQAPSASNKQDNRAGGHKNAGVEVSKPNKKDYAPRLSRPHQPFKDNNEWMDQSHDHLFVSDKKNVGEAPHTTAEHQEPREERKHAPLRGQSRSLNPGSGVTVEPPLASNMDIHYEQHSSSGFRKNVNQNNRFGRGHESRGDWGLPGQDNKQHNAPANWEKQRQNTHYEYQAMGSNNNDKTDNSERRKDGSLHPGPKSRERGHNHSRRGGNFNGRQSGNARADIGYD